MSTQHFRQSSASIALLSMSDEMWTVVMAEGLRILSNFLTMCLASDIKPVLVADNAHRFTESVVVIPHKMP